MRRTGVSWEGARPGAAAGGVRRARPGSCRVPGSPATARTTGRAGRVVPPEKRACARLQSVPVDYPALVAALQQPVRGAARRRAGAARQAHLQPVPRCASRHRRRGLDVVGLLRGAVGRPVGAHRRRARHDDLRGPRRGDAAARADAAGGPAAQDHHPRRRGHRPGHRVHAASAAARPHESVLEMDVLTGDGRVVTAHAGRRAAELFRGFPNSYGTLGYALRLRIELEPVRPVRRTCGTSGSTAPGAAAALSPRSAPTGDARGRARRLRRRHLVQPTDEVYLTLGDLDRRPRADAVSDYTGERIYYRSHPEPSGTTCSPRRLPLALGHRLVLVLAGLRRAEPLGAPVAAARASCAATSTGSSSPSSSRTAGRPPGTGGAACRSARRSSRTSRSRSSRLAEFMDVFAREVPIEPVWFCPLRQRDRDVVWDALRARPATCSTSTSASGPASRSSPGEPDGTHNRLVERLVERPRRPQVALLHVVLRARGVLAALRRDAYDVLKKTLRPGRPAARPLRQVRGTALMDDRQEAAR